MAKRNDRFWAASDRVADVLKGAGWRVELADEHTVIGWGERLVMRARLTADVIEFGVRKDFDRWANSVDLTFDTDAFETGTVEEAIAVAEWALKEGLHKGDRQGAVDLNDHLRTFRKRAAKAG